MDQLIPKQINPITNLTKAEDYNSNPDEISHKLVSKNKEEAISLIEKKYQIS